MNQSELGNIGPRGAAFSSFGGDVIAGALSGDDREGALQKSGAVAAFLSLLQSAIRNPQSAIRIASLLLPLLLVASAHATQFGTVNICWQSHAPLEIQRQVESALKSQTGTAVSEPRLSRILESTLALLADHGYHHAELEPRNFQAAGDSLSFDLIIAPGRIATIAKWELLGLVRTDSLWLASVLDLPTGTPATAANIRNGVARLGAVSSLALSGPAEIVNVRGDSAVAIHLRLRETSPAQFEGALAAGSVEGASPALLGRLSLGLNGLFRRDHSLAFRYEHPQPTERLIHLEYSERLAFSRHVSTSLQLEDWRREDHRQRVGMDATFAFARHGAFALTSGLAWQKIAPLLSATSPARLLEGLFGIGWEVGGRHRLATRGVYSRHRQWDRATGMEASEARIRLEAEGHADLGFVESTRLLLSFGSRWWGKGERRAGDEWFLGGEILRGYDARSLAAASGVWSRLELSRKTNSGLGGSLFGEYAWLTMFDANRRHPQSAGLALLFDSPRSSGRLELVWRDGASLRDGILRLSVVQGW